MSTTQSINTGTVTTLSDTDLVLAYDSGGTLKPISKANLASLIRDSIKVGGRNLLRDSGTPKTSSEYTFGHYLLTEAPSINEECVLTIWGTLGEDRTEFTAFNSSGTVYLKNLTKVKEGVYQAKFKWPNGKNSSVWLYHMPSTASSASTVNHIKLERGNVATDWTPAPEDYLTQSGGVISCTSSRYAEKGGRHERVDYIDPIYSSRYSSSHGPLGIAEWYGFERLTDDRTILSDECTERSARGKHGRLVTNRLQSYRRVYLATVDGSHVEWRTRNLLPQQKYLFHELELLGQIELYNDTTLIVTKRRKEVAA